MKVFVIINPEGIATLAYAPSREALVERQFIKWLTAEREIDKVTKWPSEPDEVMRELFSETWEIIEPEGEIQKWETL